VQCYGFKKDYVISEKIIPKLGGIYEVLRSGKDIDEIPTIVTKEDVINVWGDRLANAYQPLWEEQLQALTKLMQDQSKPRHPYPRKPSDRNSSTDQHDEHTTHLYPQRPYQNRSLIQQHVQQDSDFKPRPYQNYQKYPNQYHIDLTINSQRKEVQNYPKQRQLNPDLQRGRRYQPTPSVGTRNDSSNWRKDT
jgi:hypothetical protein